MYTDGDTSMLCYNGEPHSLLFSRLGQPCSVLFHSVWSATVHGRWCVEEPRATHWLSHPFGLCHLLLVSCWICATRKSMRPQKWRRVTECRWYLHTHPLTQINTHQHVERQTLKYTHNHTRKHKLIFHCSTDQMQFPTIAYLLGITYVLQCSLNKTGLVVAMILSTNRLLQHCPITVIQWTS